MIFRNVKSPEGILNVCCLVLFCMVFHSVMKMISVSEQPVEKHIS